MKNPGKNVLRLRVFNVLSSFPLDMSSESEITGAHSCFVLALAILGWTL